MNYGAHLFTVRCHVFCVARSRSQSSGRLMDRNRPSSSKGDIRQVHDPSIIKEGDTYYLFSTRAGIAIRCSNDLISWRLCGDVFAHLPEWAVKDVPGLRGLWAPDVSYFNGKYHLYYSVSTFGSNRSSIGLATNRTLDPASDKYRWVDQGKVISSNAWDDWNAIDPNVVLDEQESTLACVRKFLGRHKTPQARSGDRQTFIVTTKLFIHSPAAHEQQTRQAQLKLRTLFGRITTTISSFLSTSVVVERTALTTFVLAVRGISLVHTSIESGKPMMDGGGTLVVTGAAGGLDQATVRSYRRRMAIRSSITLTTQSGVVSQLCGFPAFFGTRKVGPDIEL